MFDFQCFTATGFEIIVKCRAANVKYVTHIQSYVRMAMEIASDVLIVVVSGNIVWRVSIKWKKKLMISGICGLTVAMVATAIIRNAYGYQSTWLDLCRMLL
ncbi:hypothetical protein QBC36DRAFT_295277 [Triangularia setosa]|uniref:Rhodopsin domain-containing protein n=1 Tax=Triangularia setosa TaxID=2587417 RepID=A0AAN6VXH5_9PEZI|nr:hypothetical protein QBC36DRAFT_295277 [Podospora setosa]